MKVSGKILCVCMFFFPFTAHAGDLKKFYGWVSDVVVKSELLSERDEDGYRLLDIRVKNNWDSDEISESFRMRLPTVLVCSTYASELENENRGIHARVIFDNQNPKQRHLSDSWLPGKRDVCAWLLPDIETQLGTH